MPDVFVLQKHMTAADFLAGSHLLLDLDRGSVASSLTSWAPGCLFENLRIDAGLFLARELKKL